MDGMCKRYDVLMAAQLNGQPHTAENVIGEVPQVEPVVDLFYPKPSR
ncbi:hypothetical protein RAB80_003866 [Fusarium oxysporum f. sp. vasinfectum]|nr:hypothetical protein RAB80_003866 [Fusarium oxysporum f. sp. vasinfectum]